MLETTHKIIHLQYIGKGSKKIVNKEDIPTCYVSRKHGTLIFTRKAVTDLGMDGMFVKIMCEPTKKIIAWKIEKSVNLQAAKDWRLVKKKVGGQWVTSITAILKSFNGSLRQDSYSDLLIKKNVTPAAAGLDAGDTFYYIELKDQERDLSKVHIKPIL